MILVIRPLGEGVREHCRWLLRAGLYAAGLLSTSALVGALFGGIGLGLMTWNIRVPAWTAGVIAFAYAFRELNILHIPIIQRKWQVPIDWVQRHPIGGAWLYGSVIGSGFLTYITYPGFYVWTAVAISSADPRYGAALGLAYGLGRALPVFVPGLLKHVEGCDPFATFSGLILANERIWRKISACLLLIAGAMIVGLSP